MGLLDRWRGQSVGLTDGGFWKGFFNLGTHSGETMSAEKSMQLDAVWACVKLVSEVAGTLPCMVYDGSGSTVRQDHPLYELLHNQPNDTDSAVEFWEMVARSLLIHGNAYAEKRHVNGRLQALIPIPPEVVRIERRKNGEKFYQITEKGQKRDLGARNMFHVRNMAMPGNDYGMSPTQYARHTLGAATSAEKTAGKMFASGMQAAGILTSESVMSAEQRDRLNAILQQYAGSDRAGKIMTLEKGLTYQQLSMTPEDAQMLDTRRFSVEQVCRWYGVPLVMVGHAAQGLTTWGSGVEQIILQFSKTGLRPLLKRIEAAIRRDLLEPVERGKIKVEFNMEGLLRGDSAARSAFYSTMVQNGVMTRNECRTLENRQAISGADALTAQVNLAPLNLLGTTKGGQPERTD